MNIPITRTAFGPEEEQAVIECLRSGWVVQGPKVREFEERIEQFTDASHCVATTSCTTALHLAHVALGLEPGDEVVVPAFTWISTANSVEYCGAKAVFCDVSLDTFNIDPVKLEACITPRTRGLLPVHLFGLPAAMDMVMSCAEKHGLFVVEDAACGLAARHRNRHVGTLGDAGCFSFHPRKSVTTAEGGALTTDRADVASRCRELRDHGASRSDRARHEGPGAFLLAEYDVLGFNYRMTDLQGAVGAVQMSRAADIHALRSARAHRYDEMLRDVEWLRTPQVPDDCVHGYQAYVCLFAPDSPRLERLDEMNARRNQLMTRLEGDGIATRQGTHAAALQGYYRERYGLRVEDFPNAALAEGLSLTLPLFPQMTDEEQDRVVERLLHHGPG